MKNTTISNADGLIARTITVEHEAHGSYITVSTANGRDSVCAVLRGESKPKLIDALLGENATVITDLPKAENDGTYAETPNGVYRRLNANPAEILEHAKDLLAIHATLVKHNEEQEAAKVAEAEAAKAKETARNKRRDELAEELSGARGSYGSRTHTFQAAIDRIIELEEAAKVS